MASIDKINVKGEEYVINEDKWADNDNKWADNDNKWDSISPATHEVCEGVTAIKRGGIVTIRIFNFKATSSMGYERVGSIPADWVCSLGSVLGSLYHSGGIEGKCYVEVMATGVIAIDCGNKAGTIHGTLTYAM